VRYIQPCFYVDDHEGCSGDGTVGRRGLKTYDLCSYNGNLTTEEVGVQKFQIHVEVLGGVEGERFGRACAIRAGCMLRVNT